MKSFFKRIVFFIVTWEAKYLLKKFQPFIIAITGNLGKTSTKEAVYQALKNNLVAEDGEALVLASKKSFNSEIGIPLAILELESGYSNIWQWLKILFWGFGRLFLARYYKYLILEVGADRPGDIKNITAYLKPEIVILTGFQEVPVHVENFGGDREKLIREKEYLIEALKAGGTLIYNLDDPDCRRMAEKISQTGQINLKSFSLNNQSADIFGKGTDFNFLNTKLVGMRSQVVLGKEEYTLRIFGSLGESLILNSLPAFLVGQILKLDLQKISLDLEKMKTPNGRAKILDGVYNTILVDGSYNASPKAVEDGLQAVFALPSFEDEKKIFVLGDMLELGEYTRPEHLKIGELVGSRADYLVISGIRATLIAEGALRVKMPEENIFQCDDSISAGKKVLNILETLREERFQMGLTEKDLERIQDVIYLEGSQGARMERTVKMLLASHQKAATDLVRQDNYWINKK